MRNKLYLAALATSLVLSLSGCASTDDRPIPGTAAATDTKKSWAQNDTPRTNPTPNPDDPDSQPPDSTTQVIVTH